jgi:hypothetical protein
LAFVTAKPSTRIGFPVTDLGHLWRRCITASIKKVVQRTSIRAIMRSDGDNPGPWFSAVPLIPNFDIHSLADNLEDDPAARLFGGMNHAFASMTLAGSLRAASRTASNERSSSVS